MAQQNMIGKTILGYTVSEKLGSGAFGTVYKVVKSNAAGQYIRALKHITIPTEKQYYSVLNSMGGDVSKTDSYFSQMLHNIVSEIRILNDLSEKGVQHIVRYYENDILVSDKPRRYDIFILMEYLTPLEDFIQHHAFQVYDVVKLGLDILAALQACHQNGVIHRDIKNDNIFVSDKGEYKLGDFGVSKVLKDSSKAESLKGTPNFLAPEVYLGKESYNKSVDLYSLGIVLYRLLNYNRNPFLPKFPEQYFAKDEDAAFEQRMSGQIPAPPSLGGEQIGSVIVKAISGTAERFQTADAFIEALNSAVQQTPDQFLNETINLGIAAPQRERSAETGDAYGATLGETLASPSHAGNRETKAEHGMDSMLNRHFLDDIEEAIVVQVPAEKQQAEPEGSDETVQHEKAARKKKVAVMISVALIVSLAAGVGIQHSRTKQYQQLMEDGTAYCETEPQTAAELFLKAQWLRKKEAEPFISYAYALYCMRDYAGCISYIEDDLALGKSYTVEEQSELNRILAAAYFEQKDYAAAAAFFRTSAAGGDLTVSAMQDYAVSLGRLGDIQAADEVLQRMYDAGVDSIVTDYVQAEVKFAQENYKEAETMFLDVLNSAEDETMQKRALRSLAEVYRACSALSRTNESPISYPATREVELLTKGMNDYGLQYDSTMWEMLALAYFESYRTDASVGKNYLVKAAECFNQVIQQGVRKNYLYINLYTIYYELGDYTQAETALQSYQQAFPNDYMPHALRGMLLITIENAKPQAERNYQEAKASYEKAGQLLTSADDATYYQQLGTYIQQLEQEHWL